ncbi:elongation factor-1 alpha [Methylophaga pinxianii]|uniref:elongation factor-1 alpha n=1 Tax=Methylophaga pinxianii TaxID=2881052 RepID=UPI001CF46E9E|nr:elongation factor-1 alpha [Methylophaga pinxianii]MCB2428105.1 elongation factor-1 alpha [Methylophaga pinxianii]UPH45427.1 elongation factor-1 alpha [Methylophaga pinxianii]
MATNHNLNLASQGTSLKALFTGYLVVVAVGYLMAIVQIQLTHGLADGKYGLSVDDIVYSYYGNRSNSLLENKLHGSMKPMATDEERAKIISWVHAGATEDSYENDGIRQIFDAKCIVCHNADAGGAIPDYSDFKQIKERAVVDTGASIASLARVSHIHLFGIAFIFMFVGLIFSLAAGVPKALKVTVISMPYIFLLVDISAWWLTKLHPNFAWFVIIAGGAMALSFAFMWVVSMYEMWILPRIREDNRDALLDE